MFDRNFYKNVKALMLAGGNSDITDANYPASTAYIDTNGFDHVTFLVGCPAVTAPDFAVYQDTSATETAGIKALTGAAKTDVATGDDGKWFSIEFPVSALDTANAFRYVTLKATNTAGGDKCNIWCFLSRGGTKPVSQSASYLEGVILGSAR